MPNSAKRKYIRSIQKLSNAYIYISDTIEASTEQKCGLPFKLQLNGNFQQKQMTDSSPPSIMQNHSQLLNLSMVRISTASK